MAAPRLMGRTVESSKRDTRAYRMLGGLVGDPLAIEREGRGDVSEMREPLREVAEELLAAHVVLLGEQPELVRASRRVLEELVRLRLAALFREHLREPERAGEKNAFSGRQTVLALVAHDQAVDAEPLANRIRRADHARVVPGDELDAGQQQQGRIELAAAEAAHEVPASPIEPARLDEFPHLRLHLAPASERRRKRVSLGERDAAGDRGPAHDLRVHEVSRLRAD